MACCGGGGSKLSGSKDIGATNEQGEETILIGTGTGGRGGGRWVCWSSGRRLWEMGLSLAWSSGWRVEKEAWFGYGG
jgi:hypothetical protein